MLSKEKNFIVFTNENGRTYRYNFERGVWYSFTGNEIKNCPSNFVTELCKYGRQTTSKKCNDMISYLGVRYLEYWSRPSISRFFNDINFIHLDKILNIVKSAGAYLTFNQVRQILENHLYQDMVFNHSKDFLNLLKANQEVSIKTIFNLFAIEHNADLFSVDEQTKILVPKEFIEATKITIIEDRFYNDIYSAIKEDKSLFNKIVLWKYKELQHYLVYNRNAWTMIRDAIKYSKILERKLERNNFVKQLVELSRDFALKKDELSIKAIQTNIPKELAYKDENFTIILPTCPNDFVEEGRCQQNCVGSYVDSVVENETWVVFIRKTNDINKSYITCEINPHSKTIRQFLLPRNCRPKYNSIEELFRMKYQDYLYTLKLS